MIYEAHRMHMLHVENSYNHMIWMAKFCEHLNSNELPSEYFFKITLKHHLVGGFGKQTFRVSSICLNEDESLVAGCSTSLVVVFDTSSSVILQTIHVPCLSISLIGSYIITGDAEGTIGKEYTVICLVWLPKRPFQPVTIKFAGSLKTKMLLWMRLNELFLVKVFYQHHWLQPRVNLEEIHVHQVCWMIQKQNEGRNGVHFQHHSRFA